MTEESFDKAVDLRSEIHKMHDLCDTLVNSVGNNRSLIARYNTTGDTINTAVLNADICEKLVAVVRKEIESKEKEFENL